MFLIVGSKGMLGSALKKTFLSNGKKFTGLSRNDLDFLEFNLLEKKINEIRPSVIINCAAKININECEENFSQTSKINTQLPIFLNEICVKKRIKFIQISTDHFFDNSNIKKNNEESKVVIKNSYALQKYEAENQIKKNKDALIIRTSILGYNERNSSLIQWILKEIKQNKEIIGFKNVYTSSIDVYSLSYLISKYSKNLSGIYNIGSSEIYSKYDLIKKIISKLDKTDQISLKGIYVEKTDKRAHNCGLDCAKFISDVKENLPDLDTVLKKLRVKEAYEKI